MWPITRTGCLKDFPVCNNFQHINLRECRALNRAACFMVPWTFGKRPSNCLDAACQTKLRCIPFPCSLFFHVFLLSIFCPAAHCTLNFACWNFKFSFGTWLGCSSFSKKKKKSYMPRKRCLNLSIISARLGHAGVWWIFIMQALQRHLLLSLLLLPLLLLFPLLTSQNFGQTNEKWISCLCLCLAYVECSTRLGWAPLHTVCVRVCVTRQTKAKRE